MKIALCDHQSKDMLQAFIDLMDSRGHEVELFQLIDVCALACAVKRWEPDVVLSDLCREPGDLPLPPEKWWGFRLVRELRKTPPPLDCPIAVRSRFMTPEVRKCASEVGISDDGIFSLYTENIRDVAELLEDLVRRGCNEA